jgi:NAD(P)-dependent dehydrogenase (short-subunit alcohol dehydrogenase family)
VLLVTGGSRGIGAAIAQQAAADDWDVAVNYADDRVSAVQVAQAVEAAGRRAVTVRADVSDEAAPKGSGWTASARASSTPRSIPPAAIPTGRTP